MLHANRLSPSALQHGSQRTDFSSDLPCKSSLPKPCRGVPENPLFLRSLQVPRVQMQLTPQPSPDSLVQVVQHQGAKLSCMPQ